MKLIHRIMIMLFGLITFTTLTIISILTTSDAGNTLNVSVAVNIHKNYQHMAQDLINTTEITRKQSNVKEHTASNKNQVEMPSSKIRNTLRGINSEISSITQSPSKADTDYKKYLKQKDSKNSSSDKDQLSSPKNKIPDDSLVFQHSKELNLFTNEISSDHSSKLFSRPLKRFSNMYSPYYQPISIGIKEKSEHYIFSESFEKTSCRGMHLDNPLDHLKVCNNRKEKYFYQSSENTPQVQGYSGFKFFLEEGKVEKKTGEFLFTTCDKIYSFIWLNNIFNETVAKRAKAIENRIKKELNLEKIRPLSVVVLVFDSASRQGFYRNMKEFVKFMNESIIANNSQFSEDFMVYDFLGSNSNLVGTIPNMAPLLFGQSQKTIFSTLKEEYLNNEHYQKLYVDYQIKNSLWSYFRENGFVTMVSIESALNFVSMLTGHTLIVDHTTASFWNLCYQHLRYEEFLQKGLCLGNKLPHQHALDYLSEYLKNYIGHSRFTYSHINLAHEHAGMRLFEADVDMKNFFIQNLNMYKNLDEDVVFFIMADHGKSKGDTIYLDFEGELLLPAHFVIANKKFIREHKLHTATDINTSRLLSRYDWYKTVKTLARAPYTNLHNSSFGIETEVPSIFIFNEVAPIERTCEMIDIPNSHCLSKKFINIPIENWQKNDSLSFFINESISAIDKHARKYFNYKCKPSVLGSLVYIKKHSINRPEENLADHFLILYSLKNIEKSRFFIHAAYSETSKGISFKIPNGLSREKQSERISSKKEKQIIINKIWTIARFDYDNTNNDPTKCENNAFYDYNYLKAARGFTCREACEKHGLVCEPFMFYKSFLEYLSDSFEIIIGGNQDSMEIHGNSVIYGEKEMCSSVKSNYSSFCSCFFEN